MSYESMSKSTNEMNIANFTIRYNDNAKKAIAFHTKIRTKKKLFNGDNFLIDAMQWCRSFDVSPKDWEDIKKVNITFNVDFMKSREGQEFYFILVRGKEGRTFLNLSNDKDSNAAYIKASNKSSKAQNTICANSHTTPEALNSFDLLPNARYALVETSEINTYELIFDSVVLNDSYRMGIPGLGINSY